MRTREYVGLTAVVLVGVTLISALFGDPDYKSPGQVQAEGDAWKDAHDQNAREHERTIDSIGR